MHEALLRLREIRDTSLSCMGYERAEECGQLAAYMQMLNRAARSRWHKGEKEMSDFCSSALHGLLSGEGRELQNIKLLAGSSPTKEGMCAAM